MCSLFASYSITDMREIRKLTSHTIPTPQDRIPNRAHLKKRGYAEWSRGYINAMIRNTAYMGVFHQFQNKKIGGRSVFNKNKDEWIGVPIPIIVGETLFDAAQKKMDRGRELAPRNARFEYLVSRRISCECGYKIRVLSSSKTETRADGTLKEYTYQSYICPGKLKSQAMAKPCDLPSLTVAAVDERVWEWVKEEITNPKVLGRKLWEIQMQQQQGNQGKQETLQILYAHRDTINEELRKIGILYTKGMPGHIVERMISEQTTKLKLVEGEIRKTEEKLETPLTDEIIDSLLLFSIEFSEHLEAVEQPLTGRRTVIEELDVQVKVFRREGELWLKFTSILRPKGKEVPLSLINPC